MNAITEPGHPGVEETLARYGVGELTSAWPGSPATRCAYRVRTRRAGKDQDYLFLRVDGRRFVSEVVEVAGFDGERCTTNTIYRATTAGEAGHAMNRVTDAHARKLDRAGFDVARLGSGWWPGRRLANPAKLAGVGSPH